MFILFSGRHRHDEWKNAWIWNATSTCALRLQYEPIQYCISCDKPASSAPQIHWTKLKRNVAEVNQGSPEASSSVIKTTIQNVFHYILQNEPSSLRLTMVVQEPRNFHLCWINYQYQLVLHFMGQTCPVILTFAWMNLMRMSLELYELGPA